MADSSYTLPEVKRGDLPFAEIQFLDDELDGVVRSANKGITLNRRFQNLELKWQKATAARDGIRQWLVRLEALIAQAKGPMLSVLKMEQQELLVKLDDLENRVLMNTAATKQKIQEELSAIESELQLYLPLLRENRNRWQQMNELNEGHYTPEMKQRIHHYFKSEKMPDIESYNLPLNHLNL